MSETIWKKYEKLKEILSKNENIKTYLARIEPIVKEIKPKDTDDFILIRQRLEELKQKMKVYDIIIEQQTIYVVLENNEEMNTKVDQLLFSEELDIEKEGEGAFLCQGGPLTKKEIFELFKMEKSICKIESISKNGDKKKGSGFFCKLNDNFPIKYALFTNNHILDESNIEIGKTIKLEYLENQKLSINSLYNLSQKEIIITEKRKIYSNKELDYTNLMVLKTILK